MALYPHYCHIVSSLVANIILFLPTPHHGEQNIRTEPKYIVFLPPLLLLFKICHNCKSENVLVETQEHRTMITIKTNCGNRNCLKKESVWQSQPKIEGTKAAAGNILLSFATLLAGASASKVLRIFAHMGLSCHSLQQFYRHQKASSKNNHFVYFILGRFPQEVTPTAHANYCGPVSPNPLCQLLLWEETEVPRIKTIQFTFTLSISCIQFVGKVVPSYCTSLEEISGANDPRDKRKRSCYSRRRQT